MLLIELAKEFVATIDNKTDGQYNCKAQEASSSSVFEDEESSESEEVPEEEELDDDELSELYQTGEETFSPKTTVVEEKVVALLTPQLEPLPNDFDSSAPCYNIDIVETQELNNTQDSS
ncbi:unnamed protein product [Parnassius apollo]|uniref:(apollo) hypothetical protein n=1 Tax=Parnassius apollo TaxID=110799 RepID=A0A8S3XQ31_PARAO|nr:unnamed protein product [Parnassius apollo]